MRGRRLVRVLWSLVGFVVAILVAKFFVADVYRISSGSMRPTIFGGAPHEGEEVFTEWALVAYGRGAGLNRFDLVVISRDGEDPVVKRAVGLPGESVLIEDGDLVIDGKRLAPDAPRPAPIVVFDDAHFPIEDYFEYKRTPDSPWKHLDEIWNLDASSVRSGTNRGMMFYQPEIRDDYIDQNGRRVIGRRTVNDVTLECEFAIDLDKGRLRFQLVEKADTFEACIYRDEKGEFGTTHVAEIVRRGTRLFQKTEPNQREISMARIGIDLDLHAWHALRFANVDNHLRLRIDASFELTASYDANTLYPGKAPNADHSSGPRVGLGGEELRARFRRIRIRRDLHYTSFPGDGCGIGSPVWLADDEVYLLGDNSVASNDSRRFGPAAIEDLAGRPVYIVWPFGRIRRLHAIEGD